MADSWTKSITAGQWRTLAAASSGWMLDAMDVMLYAFALTAIQTEFSLTPAKAGLLASVTLLASAFGGVLFGLLADRFGRARSLVFSILTYSVCTAMTASSGGLAELLFWRSLVGIGLGGEWSAGSVLVAETWPAEHRGKAIGLMQAGWALGYIIAALLSALVLPTLGWRPLFVIGFFPALLSLWIRRRIPEPQVWVRLKDRRIPRLGAGLTAILRPPLRRHTLAGVALTSTLLFAYWGLFTWIPTYLAAPAERGGAGMGVVKSTGWIIPMQIGAFLGYISFGALADRFGRRPVFAAFVVAAATLIPLYGNLSGNEALLFLLGPLIGFFGHGYFSVFGAMLAELFPSDIRGTAQGLTYNAGRAFSALSPYIIGALSGHFGIGPALGLTSAFFLAAGGLIFLLPETRGKDLE
jgi:MFS family permease